MVKTSSSTSNAVKQRSIFSSELPSSTMVRNLNDDTFAFSSSKNKGARIAEEQEED